MFCGIVFYTFIQSFQYHLLKRLLKSSPCSRVCHASTILAFYTYICILELAYQVYIKCIFYIYIYHISSLLIILFALKLCIILGRIESSYPYIWSIQFKSFFKIYISRKLYNFSHKETIHFLLDYSWEPHHFCFYFKYYIFLNYMFHLHVL